MARLGSRLFLALLPGLTAAAAAQIRLVDATQTLKLGFVHRHSPTREKYLPETMGGGVALFDYDDDGRLDIFFTNGAKLAAPMPAGARPDKSEPAFWNRLFHQLPSGVFEDVTEKAGLTGRTDATYTMGVAAGDFDNDGRDDLYVTALGGNKLYRNLGGGRFADVTARAGVAGAGWSTSAGFFDCDRDGDLDLFVVRYLAWTFAANIYCGPPDLRAYCHPKEFPPETNLLFRNNGDGTFTDVSRAAGIAAAAGKGLGVAFADYDRDGWQDIFVANDSVPALLFRNRHDGTFAETALAAGVAYTEDGKAPAGMGVDFADFDNDLLPDLVVTDLSNEMYMLYLNRGKGVFADASLASGLGKLTQLLSGWGVRMADLDNDGWKDLFVAQGHVMDTIEAQSPHLRYLQRSLALRNERGRFASFGGSLPDRAWAGRGAALGDLDNDGDLDIVVANLGQPAYVLRNDGGNRHGWIAFDIGAGARVTVRTDPPQEYVAGAAGSYLSSSDRRLLIGTGAQAGPFAVEIAWPSGQIQKLANIETGRRHRIKEPLRKID